MATLTASNAVALYQSGAADKIVLVALRNVNTGDTLDVGPTGIGVLQTCVRAVVIGIQGGAQIAASTSGTVVTMPTGMSADDGYLTVWGSASP